MNNSTLPYWLSFMVLLTASYGGWKWYQVQQFEQGREVGGVAYSGPPLDHFELTERSGEPFRSEDMKGRVWVTTLFFSTCPGSCPRLNSNIKYLNSLEELEEVTWVSITVDPDTDTLPVLQKYADSYNADPERWLFCRGELDYVKRIGEGVLQMPVSWRGHTDYAVVFDKTGKVRGMYNATSTRETKKLQLLLLECLAEEGLEVETEDTQELAPDNETNQTALLSD